MDAADVWGRSSSSSSSSAAAAAARRLQARYDLYMGFDDADAGGDEVTDPRGGAEPYNCPFCGEDFDFVSLCCHIDDEHAVEAKSGASRVRPPGVEEGASEAGGATGSRQGRKQERAEVEARAELRTPDRGVGGPADADLHSDSSDNNFLLNKFPDEKTVERAEPSLSEKDQKERVQRSKFVRGLVLSTIFDDDNL
ncbi:unnamed protein product [Miscanthus lutarioriparius]|uniref:Uncharacterized protein n=1 Tax=Miscanthus lutarioriparius TaxID=422564 RepID=A0A811RPF5_9POAL|nr:unnamed protein product [Miscanthus lutarioriparius]